MKRVLFITAVCAVYLASSLSAYARVNGRDSKIPSKSPRKNYVEGELLVTYDSGVSTTAAKSLSKTLGATPLSHFRSRTGEVHRLRVTPGQEDAMMKSFRSNTRVKAVQKNYIYRMATTIPNDPKFSELWGLNNTGQTLSSAGYFDAVDSTHNPGTSGKDMGLESAWDRITDCSSEIVAVIDTGVNYDQEDLVDNMWDGGGTYPHHGWNYVDGNDDPIDLNGHGTHVAGTIGAVGNNSIGSTGVCWNVQLMAIRALDANGSGTTSSIAQGIYFASANGATVINMSLGGSSNDPQMSAAIDDAATHGVVVVVAAGNDGLNNDSGNSTYPCNYTQSNLICVAALDQSYSLASFSNYGATSVDVGAPGVNIVSPWTGNQTLISDAFNTSGTLDWTNVTNGSGTGWDYSQHVFSSGGVNVTYDTLTNPYNWDGSGNNYSDSADDSVYKTFNLSSYNTISLAFYAFYDLESTHDYFKVYLGSGSSDPTTSSGNLLDNLTGSSGGSADYLTYDLSACSGSSCSVGFRMTSDASTNSTGVAILDFYIDGLTIDATHYNILRGTSMATPHVAGLAAMIAAYNPSYTTDDIIESIKNGGVATSGLSGKTTTGNSVSAIGSLNYISKPQSVSVVLN